MPDGSRRVGFVGLGRMGRPMAKNLAAAGFSLTVRDVDPACEARFAAEHDCVVADGARAFAGLDVVVTMLPDAADVRQAILEWDGGVGSSLSHGSVVVDMSSSDPEGTRSLGERLRASGVALVDAPVSGGVPRAEAGTLTLMVGGDDEAAIARAQPVLDVLGDRMFRTGPLGSGHAMKALNNFVGGATYAVVVEALAVGRRFGLDPETMIEVLNASTGRSFNTEYVFKEHVLTGAYGTGFSLGLLSKDIGIAAGLAAGSGVDAPLVRIVSDWMSAAAAGLGADADHSEAHKHWWTGNVAAESAGGR